MSARTENIACPMCHTLLSLEQITRQLDDELSFAHMVALSVPLGDLVMQYISLFTPPLQGLTLRKKLRIINQLLPDMRRWAITHKGRDWATPKAAWEQAFEQMQAARSAGRLDLPMNGHGYLYAILAGIADKAEGAAEAQANAERFQAARAQAINQRTAIQDATRLDLPMKGDALQQAHGGRDPALVKAEADARNAAPMPAAVRAQLAALRGLTTPTTPQNTEENPQ